MRRGCRLTLREGGASLSLSVRRVAPAGAPAVLVTGATAVHVPPPSAAGSGACEAWTARSAALRRWRAGWPPPTTTPRPRVCRRSRPPPCTCRCHSRGVRQPGLRPPLPPPPPPPPPAVPQLLLPLPPPPLALPRTAPLQPSQPRAPVSPSPPPRGAAHPLAPLPRRSSLRRGSCRGRCRRTARSPRWWRCPPYTRRICARAGSRRRPAPVPPRRPVPPLSSPQEVWRRTRLPPATRRPGSVRPSRLRQDEPCRAGRAAPCQLTRSFSSPLGSF